MLLIIVVIKINSCFVNFNWKEEEVKLFQYLHIFFVNFCYTEANFTRFSY